MEKHITENQISFFYALQNAAQQKITGKPKLLETQAWAANRSDFSSTYKANAKRSLYWFISINLDRAHSPIRTFDFARARGLSTGESFSGNGRQTRPSDSALDLAREQDNNLSRDLDDNFAIPFSFMTYPTLERKLNLTFDCAFKRSFMNSTTLQEKDGQSRLEFDLNTLYLVQISSIFRLLSQKKRPKAPVHKFQNVLSNWWCFPNNPLRNSKMPSFPTRYRDYEWVNFHLEIRQIAGKALGLDLSNAWDDDDLETANSYLRANLLLWDCIQNSKFENPETFEAMILKAPLKCSQCGLPIKTEESLKVHLANWHTDLVSKSCSIKLKKENIQAILQILENISNTEVSQLDISISETIQKKLDTFFRTSNLEEYVVVLTTKEWKELSKIILIATPIIKKNNNGWNDWARQITLHINRQS